MKHYIYIFLFVAFAACKTKNSAVSVNSMHPDSVFASIERSPCFGHCPAFTATIYNSGKAVYEGRSAVERQGLFTGQASAAQIERLLTAAKENGIDTLQKEYINPHLADFPGHRISIVINGVKKDISVMSTDPPSGIEDFEKIFELILEEITWTKTEIK